MRRVKKGKSLKDNREIPNITICRDRFPISVAISNPPVHANVRFPLSAMFLFLVELVSKAQHGVPAKKITVGFLLHLCVNEVAVA